jgi:hypothetical protein
MIGDQDLKHTLDLIEKVTPIWREVLLYII